jgi:hypothetical protein
MTARLDENCGADGWAMTPIDFLDATLASAFFARGAPATKVETAKARFQSVGR